MQHFFQKLVTMYVQHVRFFYFKLLMVNIFESLCRLPKSTIAIFLNKLIKFNKLLII